jgi:parvulin-like peptidyl-prolyl isomerase
MLGNTFRAASASEVARQFGREFAVNLGGLQPGPWQGPVESGFGVHLVCIRDRTEGRLPALVEVRDAVRREWDDAHRRKANEAFYQELLKHYTVIIEEPVAAGTPVNVSQVQ